MSDTRSIEAQLEHLAQLPANWDSYGAPAITREAVEAARIWLKRLWIWPRSNGGLTLGWDDAGQDVHIAPDGVFESDEDDDVALPAPEPAPPEPGENAIEAALNVAPEVFQPALPYGGLMVPALGREDVLRMLRAAYSADYWSVGGEFYWRARSSLPVRAAPEGP
jgi:hypothetical protein